MLGDQRGADCVDGEIARQPFGRKLVDRLFRSPLSVVEQAGGDDHQIGGGAFADPFGGGGDAGLFLDIDMALALARPGEAGDAHAFFLQRIGHRLADPARGTDDDRPLPLTHRTNLHRVGVLASASNA